MYYPESSTIADKHPPLADQVRTIDQYLGKQRGQLFRLGRAADLLHLEPALLKRLLSRYRDAGVVQEVIVWICPEDRSMIDFDQEGALWCDLCATEYAPDECEREIAYRPKLVPLTTPQPDVGHDVQPALSAGTRASPLADIVSATQDGPVRISRKADLERSIRESYEIIRGYEQDIQVSNRHEERLQAQRQIERQWGNISQYLEEYTRLVGNRFPSDIAEIAKHFAAHSQGGDK
jgi:hypothetical protein